MSDHEADSLIYTDAIKSALKDITMARTKQEKPLSEEDQALNELTASITLAMSSTTETFMLGGPISLTVKKPGGAYSKQAHVGSEDFAPVGCYLGKRGKFIYVFKPVMVSDYVEMEIDESLAYSSLVGFKEWLNSAVGNIANKKAEAVAQINAKAEQERLANRFDTYKNIGFGSW